MQQYLDLLARVLTQGWIVMTEPAPAQGRCLGIKCGLTLPPGFLC